MEKVSDKINLFYAGAVTLLSAVFGVYWYLFAAFLLLNAVDYATGILKARYTGTENSNRGARGIIKKVSYWLIIGMAFFISYAFGDLGMLIGINLGFTILIGWFTLATFIINEIRSILENLVEIGVEVPVWLTKGLEVANNKIGDAVHTEDE